MHPIRIDQPSAAQHAELDHANRTAKDGRLRIRALIVLLAAERGMVAAEIAAVVRMHEHSVRRWLVRYQAEGLTAWPTRPAPVLLRVRRSPTGTNSWPWCAAAPVPSTCPSRSGPATGSRTTWPNAPACG